MADLSRVHAWINSAGIILTLALSGYSISIACKAYQLKEEEVSSSSLPNNDCQLQYHKMGDSGIIGICWIVTIGNKSENKLSLVSSSIFNVDDQGRQSQFGVGFTTTEEMGGGEVNFPVALDGGGARRLLVRAPVQVPASVAKVINDLSTSSRRLSLHDAEAQLAEHGLDLLGNSIEVIRNDGRITGRSWTQPYRSVTTLWELTSGRGRRFQVFLFWPPRPDQQ